MYINTYYCVATHELVSGKNTYNTKEEAIQAQNCPSGYIYHMPVLLRNW